ncbi:energy transducer TonB [Endozoicomonas euniceicola]|uniref:TonB family protein n=1 Tax=Endozoicomonas euniceicola TaxID=1234143 RepID=A0ABY6GQ76_9GAMM|nr:energy transducer TonB [Endozoicomonas euniceicola]UYM14306.1 TonB family protein [Endozoicomonas euniceicola]
MLSHPQTRKAAPETPRPVSETPALTETTIATSHADKLLKPRRSENKTPAPSAEKTIAGKALTEEAIAKATFTKEAVNESPDTHKPNAYSRRQPDHNSDFEQWLATLQYMINQNKTYPYQARRLNRSGNVEVLLEVNPDGSLIKAEIIRGRKVFHNSTLKAVRSAFPAGRTHKDRPVTLHVTVHYQLRQP